MSYASRYGRRMKSPGFVRSYLPDDLPHIPNYASALAWYESVKPFARGGKVGQKPLGKNRRYNRFTIEKGGDGQIMVKHYNTYIVTYLPDNSFYFKAGPLDSISTCQAMQELIDETYFTRKKGKIYFQDRNGHFFRVAYGLRVGADSVAQNPPTEQVYVLNRARFKDLRAKYKRFTDYTKQIVSLTHGGRESEAYLAGALRLDGDARLGGRYGDWALRTDAYAQQKVRQKFFEIIEETMQIEDEGARAEAMYPIAQFLSFSAATDWNTQRMMHDIQGPSPSFTYVWSTNTKRVDKFFGDLLKYQYPVMCFDLVDAPVGKVTHNPNKKFIKTR